MARMKKDQLLFLVYSLEKINTKMAPNSELDSEVYIWCQQQGMDIGEYLEGTYCEEANTTAVVTALEDYCEQIYQLSITKDIEQRQKLTTQIQRDLEITKGEITRLCSNDPE